MEFKEKIRKYRAEHRLTQEKMAELAGVTRQTISRWEEWPVCSGPGNDSKASRIR